MSTVAEAMTDQSERDRIIATLRQTNGNKRQAARQLNISRGTLYRRLKEHSLGHLIRQPLEGLDEDDVSKSS